MCSGEPLHNYSGETVKLERQAAAQLERRTSAQLERRTAAHVIEFSSVKQAIQQRAAKLVE
jgi:hypothetical protein